MPASVKSTERTVYTVIQSALLIKMESIYLYDFTKQQSGTLQPQPDNSKSVAGGGSLKQWFRTGVPSMNTYLHTGFTL